MQIECIAEHSVDVSLLSGGICIDVGCRGFQFSEGMRDLGCKVHAFDLEEMQAPPGITFHQNAIGAEYGKTYYCNTKDAQANHIANDGVPVWMFTLPMVYGLYPGVVDVLKLDCEGSEYHILSDVNFQPIPRQITIEFHEHCHKDKHWTHFETCMENILRDYVPVKHDRYAAHGAGLNYWDSLFIRKDLL